MINTIFRAIHSTKGAAGFLGLESTGTLAHSIENVLNLIRTDELLPSSHSTDVLLSSIDCLKALLADVENSNHVDVTSHRASLDHLAETFGREPHHGRELGSVPPAPTHSADRPTLEVAEVRKTTDGPEGSPAALPNTAAATAAVAAGGDAQVRVSVKILDRLMSLASEMVLARNQLLQVIERCAHPALEPVAARVDQVTSDMQEVVMQSRMQPVGNIFGKFNRIVRDLGGKLGKKCDLRIEGSDVELDKTIIEAIGDPLTHLVRNSLDHGIEPPETRKSRQKHPTGSLLLRAFHQGGKVKISIVDDGAGIDAEKLKRKAVERGIVAPEQAAAMSRQDAVGLIFHAGFSMAEKVTDVSGRGVGMDVVKTNIVRIGGTVDVETCDRARSGSRRAEGR